MTVTEHDVTHSGNCYCGAFRVEVQGPPLASGLCHCEDCQKFHAAPFMAWSVWPSSHVTLLEGETKGSAKSPHLARTSCAECGGNVMGVLTDMDMTVVFPSVLRGSGFEFVPEFHQFYGERVIDLSDNVPKFVDKPEAFGGSGKHIEAADSTRWR